jgi:glycosyltransferase involved in cell wall biosynthesis
MKKEKLRVLMELRTCFEAYAGIPQETRLVFRSLRTLANIEATGLINHQSRRLGPGLGPGLFGRPLKPHRALTRLSRLAISTKADPMPTHLGQMWRYMERRLDAQLTRWGGICGKKIKVYGFDASEFGDFVWQTLFSKTLPASDYEMIREALYASIRPSWDVLNRIAVQRMQSIVKWWPLPELDTRKYDVFLSQVPWPTRVSPNTQLLVRYHDAIPVFLPHTIRNAPTHNAIHMAGLQHCRSARFVCTSEATRSDLLKIYPAVEKRSVVIPDTVSHEYYEEKAGEGYVANTIRTYLHPGTEPKFHTMREKERFYERHLSSGPLRYLLLVSTLEPRKNHGKLIAAWDYLTNHGMPDLKLVFVGNAGWDTEPILASMSSAQEHGELFHLHGVPCGQLRILYREAAAVVCPSVCEGFDLSGIEAMLCGGAVVASDIPVHREVYGNACEYFDPYSTIDLAKALERVIAPEFALRREELVEAGLRHSPRYKSENIQPCWQELFDRIRAGDFKLKADTPRQHPFPDHSSSQLNGTAPLLNQAPSHINGSALDPTGDTIPVFSAQDTK